MTSNSNNLLREIDINYLTKSTEYEKYMTKQFKRKINKNDKKFYRKRICSLTKELLTNDEINVSINPDVKKQFDEYIHTCIEYFKITDNNDIIQNDYTSLLDSNIHCDSSCNDVYIANNSNNTNNTNENINDIVEMKSLEDANNLMIRSVNVKHSSLENFVIRNKVKIKKNDMILPKQKNINLRDPLLKNKGIKISSKKKNIRNKYENTNKKDTTIEEPQTNI